MAPVLPIIISVAGVLVRTTKSQLPKLLGRFKNSRQIKSPNQKQIDEAKRLDGSFSNFGKGDKSTLVKADRAKPSFMEKLTGRGTSKGQDRIGNVGQKTGMSARNKFKLAGETVKLAGVAGIAALDRELKLSASMKRRLKQARTQSQYDTLVRLAIAEQKQKEKDKKKSSLNANKSKIKKPLKKPKDIDKIGAVRKPLRKPKGMK